MKQPQLLDVIFRTTILKSLKIVLSTTARKEICIQENPLNIGKKESVMLEPQLLPPYHPMKHLKKPPL